MIESAAESARPGNIHAPVSVTTQLSKLRSRVRLLLIFFGLGLIVSGLTAFPLVWEIRVLNEWLGKGTQAALWWPPLADWITRVHQGLLTVDTQYPFILYGTDWLAFAHLMIAIAFWGPYQDPVKNRWVIEFGMISCLMVIPLAFICGPIRGIPLYWRFIDCSFGIVGIIPLWIALRYVKQMERLLLPSRHQG